MRDLKRGRLGLNLRALPLMSAAHVLMVDCQDQAGIVHQITGVLFRSGLNIEEQGEFVDHISKHFFLRTLVSGELRCAELIAALKDVAPSDARLRLTPFVPRKIAVLVSTEAHCLGDLLIRHAYHELFAEIAVVIGNHPKLKDLTTRFGVPFHCVPCRKQDRLTHEQEIISVLEPYHPEYVVLAKYMRVLTPLFVERFAGRLINIHHSFLPAFVGARPYHQAYERGVKIIGASAHFVTAELDQGPIIAQDVIPINHSKSPEEMIQAGRDVEKIVLARALRLVFEDRVFVHRNRTIIFD